MGTSLAPGSVLQGRFVVQQVVRIGRRGVLYLGNDLQAATKAVLIRAGLDDAPAARIDDDHEARLLAGLQHPGLPAVLAHFVEPDGPDYLVIEQIQGTNLEALIQEGAQPEEKVFAWMAGAVAALEYLHSRRPPLVHGNLSPAEIVVGSDGASRLTGLVTVDDPSTGGNAPGPYSPPEQLGGQTDERSDVYALGAIVYRAISGQVPPDAMSRQAGSELPSLRRLAPQASERTEEALAKALALDPAQRPGSISAFWAMLQPQGTTRVRRRSGALPVVLVAVGVLGCLAVAYLFWNLLSPLVKRGDLLRASLPGRSSTATSSPVPATVAVAASATAQASATAARPSPSATVKATGTAQPVPSPTVTGPAPTATVPAPAATATQGPAPTSAAAPVAGATPTTRSYWPPSLLYPQEGDSLTGEVVLRWYWNSTLAADERFDVQVWPLGAQPASIAWTTEPIYRTVGLSGSGGAYRWRVRVVRVEGGRVAAAESEWSGEQSFSWRPNTGSAPTAEPPAPTATVPPPTAVPPTAVPPSLTPEPPTKAPATPVPTTPSTYPYP